MATNNKFADASGEDDNNETRICKEKANISKLKAYASSPTRWQNAHVWRGYYNAQASSVAVKRVELVIINHMRR